MFPLEVLFMISYFPEIYNDELMYSVLARYAVKSGCIAYQHVAEDLFLNSSAKPDKEFLNIYKPDVLSRITQHMSMEAIVKNHTLFPFYGRFLPKERRNRAFQAMVNMEGHYSNLLALPKRRNIGKRHLRYCPACIMEDRENYGEAYFHRIHQLRGAGVCPLHGCYLKDSSVVIDNRASLTSLEEAIDSLEIEICENETELNLTNYISDVFQTSVDFESDVLAGDFLNSRLSEKYFSVRGQAHNIELLNKDLQEYYRSLPDNSFSEPWVIQIILANRRLNPTEICKAAMFLDIPVAELTRMKLPEKSQKQLFNEKVYALREQGMKYSHIAKRLGTTIETVTSIGEEKNREYYNEKKRPTRKGSKPGDWSKMDNELYPRVRAAIKELQSDEEARPKRITLCTVRTFLGLNYRQINNMPRCKAEIQANCLNTAEHHAKEVVWASKKIMREGQPFNYANLRKLTNLSKSNLIECLPYVTKYADDELCDRLRNLTNSFQL